MTMLNQYGIGSRLSVFFSVCFFLATCLTWADEVDADVNDSGTPVITTPMAAVPEGTTLAPFESLEGTPLEPPGSQVTGESTDELASTPAVVHGVLKMKDVYEAGLAYYKQQDFARAIRYLKQSLQIHDPYTPPFYYAEADAMLGVIYQFHIIDRAAAYQYYQAALSIDPQTAMARKHIGEVSDKKDSE